jgi:hypothetical protein
MNSPFEIEQRVEWRRERLLAEAHSERVANTVRVRTRGPSVVRARIAASLYALADWLSPDDPGELQESAPLARSTTMAR